MKLMSLLLIKFLLVFSFLSHANPATYITVEEARTDKAQEEMPDVFARVDKSTNKLVKQLNEIKAIPLFSQALDKMGQTLWSHFRTAMQQDKGFDDRALYWSRLTLLKSIRVHPTFRQQSKHVQADLIKRFELACRGNLDINYKPGITKVFVTGFDPFLLDRNIKQSNPSGVAALWLDGKVLEYQGQQVQVEAFVVPVRFSDFDNGLIEHILLPMFSQQQVKMVATISMGREHFDLERFPGLRRSSAVPDNVNVFTGANKRNPLKPFLYGKELAGPEFVQFSLPVEQMQQAKGKYKIIDNHKVSTLSQSDFAAPTLDSLQGEVAVAGAGGGYLSNEISYRSILLRNQVAPNTAVGHIHTPRFREWQYDNVKAITMQIQHMLELSIPAL